MFDIVIIIIIIQIMFLSIRGKEQSREAASTVIPSGQEEETSICQRAEINMQTRRAGWAECTEGGGGGGTYESSAAASLRVVALVIPGASVGGAAVVPRREAWVIVALLRVLHPLPHVVFTSEGRRVGGGGG